jgi:hypothetical protein
VAEWGSGSVGESWFINIAENADQAVPDEIAIVRSILLASGTA